MQEWLQPVSYKFECWKLRKYEHITLVLVSLASLAFSQITIWIQNTGPLQKHRYSMRSSEACVPWASKFKQDSFDKPASPVYRDLAWIRFSTLYNGCYGVSMLGSKLIHVCKRGHGLPIRSHWLPTMKYGWQWPASPGIHGNNTHVIMDYNDVAVPRARTSWNRILALIVRIYCTTY